MSNNETRASVLILRTCDANRCGSSSRLVDGKKVATVPFQWPESGPVECDDWNPEAICGGGLHGLLWGEGDGSLLNWKPDAVWLVFEALESEVVCLEGKVKTRRGTVLYYGDQLGATEFIKARAPGKNIVGGTATAGYSGTATAGYSGTATAGNYGKATAGYSGTATAGDSGTATAGNYGKATAGNYGKATAGDSGTATAGNYGKATAGYSGTATAGYSGTATAGYSGILSIRWWDGKRYRIGTFYVGEDGIEPNVPYRCENGKAIKCG